MQRRTTYTRDIGLRCWIIDCRGRICARLWIVTPICSKITTCSKNGLSLCRSRLEKDILLLDLVCFREKA